MDNCQIVDSIVDSIEINLNFVTFRFFKLSFVLRVRYLIRLKYCTWTASLFYFYLYYIYTRWDYASWVNLFVIISSDAASRAKAEKIRLALEKMREASVQKLFIKAFTLDGSGKSLLVDEGMSVAHVCRLLADKNHVPMDPKWAVVEHLPDLFMGESIIFYLPTANC